MLKYHICSNGSKAAEIIAGKETIHGPDEMLDFMAEASLNDAEKIIIHSHNLDPGFFDLRTGLAGEILQKFSNYRMKLSIIGDFKSNSSRSLNDFIRESNRNGQVTFVSSISEVTGKI